MLKQKQILLIALIVFVMVLSVNSICFAENFPSKKISFYIGFSAGGGTDAMDR